MTEDTAMDWNSAAIEDINRRRKREKELAPEMAGREDNLLRLMSRSLYGEKVHYALELIQNAEDARSSCITFIFEKDEVTVINDGEVFTADDVDAICSVKPGRKKNKIGFFGVGFKSVFNVTTTPQVISSNFNFQIENYIYPKPLTRIPDEAEKYNLKKKGSIFVLPQSDGLPSTPELIENFNEIDDKILLFLEELKALHFIDNINGERWSITKPPSDDGLIILRDGRTDQTTKWRVFHDDPPVPDEGVVIPEGKEGITQTRIIVAFPADAETKESIKGSTVYCYLPTNKRSDMSFLVQADFVPTVGRGSIQEVEWNEWLLGKIGTLSAEGIEQMKEDPFLGKELYSFIPLNYEVQEPLMSILSDAMYISLKGKEVAKTLEGGWDRAAECVIAQHPDLPKIIAQDELKHLFGKSLSYIDTGAPERARQILTDLGSALLGEKKFVRFLGKPELINSKKPPWFLDAYAYLNEVFDVDNKDYLGNFRWDEEKKELFSQLEQTRFIFTSQDQLVPLKDSNKPDMLICYPQSMDLSEVNRLFSEGELVFLNRYFQRSTIIKRKDPDPGEEEKREKVHKFFVGIGVRSYFKQSHVIRNVILPKYSTGKYKQYDDLKLYRLLNYIRTYWSTLESEVGSKKLSEGIFDEIRQNVSLKCYSYKDGEKITDYMAPDKLYFSKRYGLNEEMEALFEGIEDIHFLHPYYLNREARDRKKEKRRRQKAVYGWKRFAEILGVWSSPRVEKNNSWVSISGKSEYNWVKREYSPSGVHEIRGDSVSIEIQKLIEYCAELENTETIKNRMTALFLSLSNNWKKYKEHCDSTYKYYYRTSRPIDLDSSSFLHYLKTAKWIPTVHSDFCKANEVFVDNKRNRSLLGDGENYASMDGSEAFLKGIGVNLEPSIDQVLTHLKEYKENSSGLAKSRLEKFEVIYSFLAEKIENEEDTDKLRTEFSEHELLYIPRKDRPWWEPSRVFWKDYSGVFGHLREYIEHDGKEIYSFTLRNFMEILGVRDDPSIEQALEVLQELRAENDTESLKGIIVKVYAYINDLISKGAPDGIDWQKYSFLTKSGEFYPPDAIYFEDDEEYAADFQGKVEFVFLPVSWVRFSSFLRVAGFSSFAESLSIKKHLGRISEMEGGQAEYIRDVLGLVESYLLDKNLDLCDRLRSGRIFDGLGEVEFYETTEIRLDISLNNDDAEAITIMDIEKEVYYSNEEKRLYVLQGTNPLSGRVAKELSRIFRGAEKEVFPFLNSVLPVANDETSLKTQLQLFGIREGEELYAGPQKAELLPPEEEDEREEGEGETKAREKEDEKEENEKPKVKPPSHPERRKGLIDPDEYCPSRKDEYVPYKKAEGQIQRKVKEVSLREGKPGTTKPPKEPPRRAGTKDAEGIAIQMVLNYEASQERMAEDRHNQKRIGYDIYSEKPDGEEMYIEVKHFGEQAGRFRLRPHQLKKAELEGDKYYIYVVAGLKEGQHAKKLYIIQNPVEWLRPEPPIEQEYSDWQSGIKEEITFENA